MTDDVTVNFDELNTFEKELGQVGYRGKQKAALAVRKTAHDIEATAKLLVPVDTGATKNTIHTSRPDGSPLGSAASTDGDLGLVAEIGPTTVYAPFLEYGTARMAPAAFMGPALDRHAWQLEHALEQIAAGTFQ